MITIVGFVIWCVIVLGIIGTALYQIVISVKKVINKDFKYCINIHKEGFDKLKVPLIKMRIKNKYKYFLVDSGATHNVLSKESFKNISKKEDEVKIVDNLAILGISGGDENKTMPVIEEVISIGRDKFTQNFIVSENWEATKKYISDNCGIEVIGLLGSEFFQKARWVIDFDNLVIWVKK